MNESDRNMYIVWKPFQRRAQTLGRAFNLDVRYYHCKWEEKGKVFKAVSYVVKSFVTLRDLFRCQPKYVFIQLAPTPLLYAAAIYCWVTKHSYISDCHNTMIYDGPFINWPFAKLLLRRSATLLVHNEDVQKYTEQMRLPSIILRDPLPIMPYSNLITEVGGLDLESTTYVLVPCGMAEDEPIVELFSAARKLPEVTFVMTWFADRLPERLREQVPGNVVLTGYLDEEKYNALYAHTAAALVLTTREGTQPSGAAEAIALGIPLVISDIRTTRRLYKDKPMYVRNEPEPIAEGVQFALVKHDVLARRSAELRSKLEEEANAQISVVKQRISV